MTHFKGFPTPVKSYQLLHIGIGLLHKISLIFFYKLYRWVCHFIAFMIEWIPPHKTDSTPSKLIPPPKIDFSSSPLKCNINVTDIQYLRRDCP